MRIPLSAPEAFQVQSSPLRRRFPGGLSKQSLVQLFLFQELSEPAGFLHLTVFPWLNRVMLESVVPCINKALLLRIFHVQAAVVRCSDGSCGD